MAFDNQSAFGRVQQHFGDRARREIGIENDHGHTSGVEKQNHHEGGGKKSALALRAKISQRADEEGDGGQEQWSSQIGEGGEGEVEHVSEREVVRFGIAGQRGGNITGSGQIAHIPINGEGSDSGAGGDDG